MKKLTELKCTLYEIAALAGTGKVELKRKAVTLSMVILQQTFKKHKKNFRKLLTV